MVIGEVKRENGRYVCPGHSDTGAKYYMEYRGRGNYVCTGDMQVPFGNNGAHILQPCPTKLYIRDDDNYELTRAVWLWKRLFLTMSVAFLLSFMSNTITILQWVGVL